MPISPKTPSQTKIDCVYGLLSTGTRPKSLFLGPIRSSTEAFNLHGMVGRWAQLLSSNLLHIVRRLHCRAATVADDTTGKWSKPIIYEASKRTENNAGKSNDGEVAPFH
ncbi:MAG TPA: hypothetical protein V6C86_02120 [Oculatellaceae cyanobacterium]